MLWWHHDLFWQESLHMCLVNWAGIVALNRDAKVDTLIIPFCEGRNGSPRHIPWQYTSRRCEVQVMNSCIHMDASHSVCHIISWIFLFNRINFGAWRQAKACLQAPKFILLKRNIQLKMISCVLAHVYQCQVSVSMQYEGSVMYIWNLIAFFLRDICQ